MKKVYIMAAIALFAFIGCQQKEKSSSESDMYATEDTTEVVNDTTAMDGTMVESSDTTSMDAADGTTTQKDASGKAKLADTISVKTVRPKVDTSNKFALADTKWKLVELNGKAVKNTSGKDYTLKLDSKTGKITGFAGCNNIMGSYLMKDANKLTFLYVGATKMACQDMGVEAKFLAMLPRIDNYMIEGNMLHLHKGKRDAFAKFEAMK